MLSKAVLFFLVTLCVVSVHASTSGGDVSSSSSSSGSGRVEPPAGPSVTATLSETLPTLSQGGGGQGRNPTKSFTSTIPGKIRTETNITFFIEPNQGRFDLNQGEAQLSARYYPTLDGNVPANDAPGITVRVINRTAVYNVFPESRSEVLTHVVEQPVLGLLLQLYGVRPVRNNLEMVSDLSLIQGEKIAEATRLGEDVGVRGLNTTKEDSEEVEIVQILRGRIRTDSSGLSRFTELSFPRCFPFYESYVYLRVVPDETVFATQWRKLYPGFFNSSTNSDEASSGPPPPTTDIQSVMSSSVSSGGSSTGQATPSSSSSSSSDEGPYEYRNTVAMKVVGEMAMQQLSLKGVCHATAVQLSGLMQTPAPSTMEPTTPPTPIPTEATEAPSSDSLSESGATQAPPTPSPQTPQPPTPAPTEEESSSSSGVYQEVALGGGWSTLTLQRPPTATGTDAQQQLRSVTPVIVTLGDELPELNLTVTDGCSAPVPFLVTVATTSVYEGQGIAGMGTTYGSVSGLSGLKRFNSSTVGVDSSQLTLGTESVAYLTGLRVISNISLLTLTIQAPEVLEDAFRFRSNYSLWLQATPCLTIEIPVEVRAPVILQEAEVDFLFPPLSIQRVSEEDMILRIRSSVDFFSARDLLAHQFQRNVSITSIISSVDAPRGWTYLESSGSITYSGKLVEVQRALPSDVSLAPGEILDERDGWIASEFGAPRELLYSSQLLTDVSMDDPGFNTTARFGYDLYIKQAANCFTQYDDVVNFTFATSLVSSNFVFSNNTYLASVPGFPTDEANTAKKWFSFIALFGRVVKLGTLASVSAASDCSADIGLPIAFTIHPLAFSVSELPERFFYGAVFSNTGLVLLVIAAEGGFTWFVVKVKRTTSPTWRNWASFPHNSLWMATSLYPGTMYSCFRCFQSDPTGMKYIVGSILFLYGVGLPTLGLVIAKQFIAPWVVRDKDSPQATAFEKFFFGGEGHYDYACYESVFTRITFQDYRGPAAAFYMIELVFAFTYSSTIFIWKCPDPNLALAILLALHLVAIFGYKPYFSLGRNIFYLALDILLLSACVIYYRNDEKDSRLIMTSVLFLGSGVNILGLGFDFITSSQLRNIVTSVVRWSVKRNPKTSVLLYPIHRAFAKMHQHIPPDAQETLSRHLTLDAKRAKRDEEFEAAFEKSMKWVRSRTGKDKEEKKGEDGKTLEGGEDGDSQEMDKVSVDTFGEPKVKVGEEAEILEPDEWEPVDDGPEAPLLTAPDTKLGEQGGKKGSGLGLENIGEDEEEELSMEEKRKRKASMRGVVKTWKTPPQEDIRELNHNNKFLDLLLDENLKREEKAAAASSRPPPPASPPTQHATPKSKSSKLTPQVDHRSAGSLHGSHLTGPQNVPPASSFAYSRPDDLMLPEVAEENFSFLGPQYSTAVFTPAAGSPSPTRGGMYSPLPPPAPNKPVTPYYKQQVESQNKTERAVRKKWLPPEPVEKFAQDTDSRVITRVYVTPDGVKTESRQKIRVWKVQGEDAYGRSTGDKKKRRVVVDEFRDEEDIVTRVPDPHEVLASKPNRLRERMRRQGILPPDPKTIYGDDELL